MNFRPEPGIVIIKLSEDTKLIPDKKTKLLKGEVISCGPDVVGEHARVMKDYAKVGDTVYFLSYDGEYDCAVIDGEKYYMVKVDDLRTRV